MREVPCTKKKKMSARLLFLSALFLGATCSLQVDPSVSTDLLWPIPNNYSVGQDMYSIDPGTFSFVPAGKGGDSDILKQALSRYMKLIFLPPPIVTQLQSRSIKSDLNQLTVTVNSDDESLGLNTMDSCKYVYIHLVLVVKLHNFLTTISLQ